VKDLNETSADETKKRGAPGSTRGKRRTAKRWRGKALDLNMRNKRIIQKKKELKNSGI